MPIDSAPARSQRPRSIPLARLFTVWLAIGLQSFGGGLSTLTLIQRAIVQQRGWLAPEQFVRVNAISQIAPGINILSITIQLGDELGGVPGIAASLLGLLLPSVSITIALTAAYAEVQRHRAVQDAFRGVIPATIGLGALTVWSMLRALLRESTAIGGTPEAALATLVIALSALLIAFRAPVIAVLITGGIVMSVAWYLMSLRRVASVIDDSSQIKPLAQAAEATEER